MCKTNYKDDLAVSTIEKYLNSFKYKSVVILCIGTDKCIGDSLGPLVGNFLVKENINIPIYGTLENPVHALNIRKTFNEIKKNHPNSTIIAIDASLGNYKDVGYIYVLKKSIEPGKGVGKTLPSYGTISILGVVDNIDKNASDSLYTIRLNFVMKMAEVISKAIINTYKNMNTKAL